MFSSQKKQNKNKINQHQHPTKTPDNHRTKQTQTGASWHFTERSESPEVHTVPTIIHEVTWQDFQNSSCFQLYHFIINTSELQEGQSLGPHAVLVAVSPGGARQTPRMSMTGKAVGINRLLPLEATDAAEQETSPSKNGEPNFPPKDTAQLLLLLRTIRPLLAMPCCRPHPGAQGKPCCPLTPRRAPTECCSREESVTSWTTSTACPSSFSSVCHI